MLLAGASAIDTPAYGGVLTFDVASSPSYAYWIIGSAII